MNEPTVTGSTSESVMDLHRDQMAQMLKEQRLPQFGFILLLQSPVVTFSLITCLPEFHTRKKRFVKDAAKKR